MQLNLSKISGLKWLFNFVSIPLLLGNLPINAATFTTNSQAGIIVNNFNQLPEDINIRLDLKAKTIAEVASLESLIGIDSGFMVDHASALAYANLLGNTAGTGSNYQQKINLSTTLMGRFFIPADNFFEFDFQGFISLSNFTNDLSLNPVSSSSKIKFLLQDVTHRQTFDIFQMTSVLNTNSQPSFEQDLLSLYINKNTQLDNYVDFWSLEDNQESLQTFFSGSYRQYFSNDTTINLVMVTQSCNVADETLEVCVRVPEPSSNLALLIGAFGGVGIAIRKMIKKRENNVTDHRQ